MNILILIPGDNARGGITNYYSSIREHLPQNIFYFKRGARNWPKKSNSFIEFFRIISDYIRFIFIVLFKRISLIQTTTAFYRASVYRDGIFILIAKILNRKFIVFFRGWNDNYVYNIAGIDAKIIKYLFFKADAIIDLSQKNIDYLEQIGYKKNLFLETTLVDNNLVKDIDIEELISNRYNNKSKTILFLSRIEKTKGVYKLLELYIELKKKDNNYNIIFAGDGNEQERLQEAIDKENIQDIVLTGFVSGKDKNELFKNADIFIFLSEFEGMPNAVLEAMAFGLPIITTNVGGISSVFEDSINGVLIDRFNKKDLLFRIDEILNNKEIYYNISKRNFIDAKQKVWSNVVAERMQNIFKEELNSK